MATKDHRLGAQDWCAFRRHFRRCRICQQRDREFAGSHQFCSVGRQLFMSETLTDEDRERLEFQARMHWSDSSRERFWNKAKAAVGTTGEWVAGLGVIAGSVWVLAEVVGHVHMRVDHNWWGYHVWKFYWAWWPVTVSFTAATIPALAPGEKNGPTRGQRLFTWNSVVAGFWLFVFGIFWAVEKLGPWLGIPAFLSVFALVLVAWVRLDARFGYLNRPGRNAVP